VCIWVFSVTILDEIVQHKRTEAARFPVVDISPDILQSAMKSRGDRRDFTGAIARFRPEGVALIAEVKRASPSAGIIRDDFDPRALAREYHSAGAACISVLTDQRFFKGSLDDLRNVRRSVPLPLLRKDFIIDERQILESIQCGADAILLIAAILGDAELGRLHSLAASAGLAVLVEVHDEHDLERALGCGARLIGINNRDLRTFKVDVAVTERLARAIRSSPANQDILLVSESGIKTRADVERVKRAGADAILVGETLMRAPAIQQKVVELLANNATSWTG